MFLREEPNQFNALHYYLAQIALEVRRSFSPKKRHRLADFLLKFATTSPKPEPLIPSTPQARASQSKQIWLSALNIKPKKP